MGIVVIKIHKRIKSMFKTLFWRIIYAGRIHIGRGTIFYPGTHVTIDGGKINIGKGCFFNHNCSINSMKLITIGKNCIFGEDVKLYDHNHKFDDSEKLIKNQGFSINKITIGDNCWIGSNVIILPGVKIGNNVVIAAGTIVTKDIEDNVVVIDRLNIDKRVR